MPCSVMRCLADSWNGVYNLLSSIAKNREGICYVEYMSIVTSFSSSDRQHRLNAARACQRWHHGLRTACKMWLVDNTEPEITPSQECHRRAKKENPDSYHLFFRRGLTPEFKPDAPADLSRVRCEARNDTSAATAHAHRKRQSHCHICDLSGRES